RTRTAWYAGCRRGRFARPERSRTRRRSSAPPRAPASRRIRTRTDRCPGTSSADSPRTAPSRRGASGTIPGGRALEGDVECDLDAESARAREQPVEILERAEARMHGLVAALAAADRPGAAGVIGRGAGAVVGPFALDLADRMDGGQIKDIEPHR